MGNERTPSPPRHSSVDERCIEAFDAELDYLFSSLRRLGAHPTEIEDLAHQVFLVSRRIWRTSGEPQAVRMHLFGVALRVIARRRRLLSRRPQNSERSQPPLYAALDRLSLKSRAVLVLHDLDDCPLTEIAATLSMTEVGAALRLRKARRALADATRKVMPDRWSASSGSPDLLLTALGMSTEDLSASASRLESVMDDLSDTIYFKDRDSRFTRINLHAAAHYRIVSPAVAVGRTDFDFFTNEHAEQALRDEQEIIRTGQPLVNIEEKETLPDGTLRWVWTTKLPLRDRFGQIVGLFGLSRDIPHRTEMA